MSDDPSVLDHVKQLWAGEGPYRAHDDTFTGGEMNEQSPSADEVARPRTSTRDPQILQRQLQEWIVSVLPKDALPEVGVVTVPQGNGMSSETLLFDATWNEAGERSTHELVARVAPDPAAVPVFPTYDMRKQFDTMRLVAERTDVPVPTTYWCEPEGGPVGAPFFVMQRIEGNVPPDVPPYPFAGWILESSPAELSTLQNTTVAVLAQLHEVSDGLELLESSADGATALERHINDLRDFYDWVVIQGQRRSPLIERAFSWIGSHLPTQQSAPVLSWGDSRIGNVMYRDYKPVAVLDWEMAAVAPREVDVAWMITIHRFFQDLAESIGMAGLPDFQRRDDIAAEYERITGYQPQDLDFHTCYAALRYAVVMFRIGVRAQKFGEMAMDADPEDMILHRGMLEAMLDGTYWKNIN